MMKLKEKFSLIAGVLLSVLAIVFGGFGTYAMAADPVTVTDGKNTMTAAGLDPQNGGGFDVPGDMTVTKTEQIADPEYYVKMVNQRICEMKFTGTPIDQILRNASSHTTNSITVKFYSVGQKPLKTTLKTKVTATSQTGNTITLDVANPNVFGSMDTILVLDGKGNFVTGYKGEGFAEADKVHALMLRVLDKDTSGKPIVYAVNGQAVNGKPFKVPDLEAGSILIRLGRAAGEKDVSTGSYYSLPEPTEQYCQRYIMQVEQSIYDRLSQKEIPWNFTDVERMAIEDMRIGMEGSGLFGVKSKTLINEKGNVYTSEGIWYRAGKEYTIGKWVTDHAEITEAELVDLVNYIIDGAGNGSRTKLFFVDNKLYSALAKIKTEKTRILQGVENFNNWGLDFESFTSMGTKLLIYRHDLFNAYGMDGCGFILDPNYIDKWVFQNWQRKEFNLRDLFISNGDAVTMEEFSCWTLQFPNAHARVKLATAPDTAGVAKKTAVNK